MPVIIGAVIGAASGAIMADQAGAQGFWEWAGYVGGGAVIGGLSGAAGAGISAAGGGAMLAGAGAGTIGGAGFSGLATGWDGQAMLNGALIGAAAGFVGGGVGSAIGGGLGALAGGAASNITGQLLSTGDVNWSQVGVSAGVSFGMYHAMSYGQWKWGGGNNIGGHDISYRQFTTMQADFQRSRFWNKEYGGWLNSDGSVVRWHHSVRHNYGISPPSGIPKNAFASYHTHWAKPGINVMVNKYTLDKASYIDVANRNAQVVRTMQYHSSADLTFDASVSLDSYVLNRFDYSYNGFGSKVIGTDPFIRFFMFNSWW